MRAGRKEAGFSIEISFEKTAHHISVMWAAPSQDEARKTYRSQIFLSAGINWTEEQGILDAGR